MSEGMPRGKTAQELRAEYERIRALADQDLIDLNTGRVRPAGSLRRMARRLADEWRQGWRTIATLRAGYRANEEWMMWAVSWPVGVLACAAAALWHTAKGQPESSSDLSSATTGAPKASDKEGRVTAPVVRCGAWLGDAVQIHSHPSPAESGRRGVGGETHPESEQP